MGRYSELHRHTAGIVAPFLTGYLADQTGNFTLPFAIASAVRVLAGLAWTVGVGPVSQIDWTRRDRAPTATRPIVAPIG